MNLKYECDLRWNDLEGTSNMRRHCSTCDHPVYNLSGMTRDQATRVIKLHEGKSLCVHFVNRKGAIVHSGDPLEQLSVQRTGIKRLLAGAVLVHVAFAALADDPGESYFDPFAALAETFTGAVQKATQPEPRYAEGDPNAVMGLMF